MNNGFSTGEEDSRGPTDGGGGSGPSGLSGLVSGVSGISGVPVSEATCCLVCSGERCRRPAGNASYGKRIQSTATQKRLRLQIDPAARHIYICDHHKAMIQSARNKQRRRKDSEDDSNETDTDVPDVDLFQLQVNTLRRYKKFYKVTTRPGFNKPQLADAIQKHFKSIPVNEKEILTYFIYTVKTNGNKLDQKNGLISEPI